VYVNKCVENIVETCQNWQSLYSATTGCE